MNDKHIKWIILFTPTLVIFFWELFRHQSHVLHYISMDLGNWLSPLWVFLVTITVVRKLFTRYDHMKYQLEKEREEKAILQERERIARELHDGTAQALFLCSVQMNAMKEESDPRWHELEHSLRQVHDYVRNSISHLKAPPQEGVVGWEKKVRNLIQEFKLDTGVDIHVDIEPNLDLTSKEKATILSCLQEALTNIRKHAQAEHLSITLKAHFKGWQLAVQDDGVGFEPQAIADSHHFGLRIMEDRAQEVGATLHFYRKDDRTHLLITKGGN
ncbi:sensor histidine kinase [Hazenella sp. IB182357]|uniref:histidine kinase n=1 Tax=Polycladospora coralii TaxID=2771432 RepID=A0A926N6B7_9BACL|nr:histidine kinase [Polycladospora coralii]MBD1371861.1 sensor histidine kinase [Polycladospora coralii]